jgi:carbon storage regulator
MEARMLVLSRRNDESILIGDDIRIVVVDIRENSVRLGIEAPKDMRVDRSEVRDDILRERAAAKRGREE